jgi:RND family efflux transporter MFP subunit
VVLQTQGAYESAKAARDIALINSATTNNTMGDTKTNGLNAINSAYATFDDVIRAKTDTAFNDPRTINPTLKALNTDSLLANKVINERKDIEEMLLERTIKNSQVTVDSDLESYLNSEIQEAQTIKAYLDDLATIYVKALPSSDYPQSAIDAQKAVISASRSTISGTITSLTSTKVAWINALASQKIAGRTTGDSNPSTAASDAQVKTALGAYNGALANLEKTIIRSPINGTLNSLGIKTGDFVNQTSQVAVVSNNGALEIVAYVSEDDAKRITPGADVTINDGIKGKVTKVASAVDPVTKKIQVKVGIVDENTELINGESVKISVKNVVTKAVASGDIKIPLSAVKITPRGNYVFILSATSSLISVPVELGALLGDQVEIKTGLSGDMQIIKDARGLKEGEVVEALIK